MNNWRQICIRKVIQLRVYLARNSAILSCMLVLSFCCCANSCCTCFIASPLVLVTCLFSISVFLNSLRCDSNVPVSPAIFCIFSSISTLCSFAFSTFFYNTRKVPHDLQINQFLFKYCIYYHVLLLETWWPSLHILASCYSTLLDADS